MINQLIIFGATGDLTSRFLLPALAELRAKDLLSNDFHVIASATSKMSTEDFRSRTAAELEEHSVASSESEWNWLVERVEYHQADATNADEIASLINGNGVGCYLALPAGLMADAIRALKNADLPSGSRIAIEKPFGLDLDDANELAALIDELFGDNADEIIFNVDHALGMAPVQAMIQLRLANPFPEAVWNSEHIEEFRMLWEESLALEGRAGFYDGTGALKDVMQNHMMLILALSTMELPTTQGGEPVDMSELRAKKIELLKSVRPLSNDDAVMCSQRARYTAGTVSPAADESHEVPDYVAEDGVDPALETETFAEVVLQVDNPRWEGTRFRLRTGKALRQHRKGIEVCFRPTRPAEECSTLWIGVDGPLDVQLTLNTRDTKDELTTLHLHGDQPEADLAPYAHVLHNFLTGGTELAVGVEEARLAWEILTPVIEAWERGDVAMGEYKAGSDGPPMINQPQI